MILTGAAPANTTEEYRNEILASVRSNRLGVPQDLAAMVAFLFSDDGAYVTGQTIPRQTAAPTSRERGFGRQAVGPVQLT